MVLVYASESVFSLYPAADSGGIACLTSARKSKFVHLVSGLALDFDRKLDLYGYREGWRYRWVGGTAATGSKY
jgi:hypothetical protein